LLAVKWTVTEKFKDYLLGSKFEFITDNNPLSYLQTSAKLGSVEQRWQAQLAQFNFTIAYRSGKLNRAADALSRMPSSQDFAFVVSHFGQTSVMQRQNHKIVPLSRVLHLSYRLPVQYFQ
jgi:hypothetical protein